MHVAVTFSDKEKAATFFEQVLELKKLKEFSVNADFVEKVFGVHEPVDIALYGNDDIKIEVFFVQKTFPHTFEHICILVKSIEELKKRCEKMNVNFFTADKEGRTLYFMRDYSGNLYEIKEK